MKYILFLLIALFSIQTFATDNGDWWLQREIQLQQNREDYARRVYGSSRHVYDTQITENGVSKVKTMVKNVVVEDVPSKQKLGKTLLTRAKAFKGGIAGVLGGAAIVGMIEAVGWVMEDGTWVKYKHEDEIPPNEYQYLYGSLSLDVNPCWCDTASEAARTVSLESSEHVQYTYKYTKDLGDKRYAVVFDVKYKTYTQQNIERELQRRINPNGIPENEPKKITITDQDVGGIASGDYKDPVDSQYDINDKKYKPPVATAYQHDPTGIGDDLANEMDEKIKTASPTPDGKPAPIGDPRYSQPPEEDQKTNDRSWQDDGAKADGDTTPKTDPVTGEPTGGQSISLKFPVFCEWAHTMCKWYDDWKISDTVYKDHVKKTEEHQTDEKTFWGKVTDWFDWTKEEPEPDEGTDSPDIDAQGIFSKTFDTNFSLSKQCPPDIPIAFESTYLSGSFTFSMNWLCIIFTFMGYPLVFLSHCVGIWILYEAVIQKEMKW